MKDKLPIESRLLTISNDIAEYPPTNLSMHEWQALIVLSSVVNSREKPILGLEDIMEIARNRGLKTKREHNALLNELVNEQNRYEMTYDEFFGYYDGETPITRKTKKDILDAMESMSGKAIITANDNKVFASFSWFDWIINDKENKIIQYSLGVVSKLLLMGLDRNFLQIMARLSIKEAKKYDIPIFVHMKSKLHNKKESYSWTEPLPEFQRRFGHEKIPSYTAWKDYYRRILSSAESYSLKSGDVAFRFEGKSTKGRKVTHIHCKVWRIGNIHVPQLKTREQKDLFTNERRKRWAEIENNLTIQQHKGYEFLKSRDINHGFLLDECITHKCLKQEVIKGYEDIFIRILWARFSTYTKARKKGGAFVTWWRRGRLTDGEHYWAAVETLNKKKKGFQQAEAKERAIMATMSQAAYNKQKDGKGKPNDQPARIAPAKKSPVPRKKGKISGIGDVLPPRPEAPKKQGDIFNYAKFKDTYKKEHQKIEDDIFKRLTLLYESAKGAEGGKTLDMEKIREIEKRVAGMLPQHCEKWYRENIAKEK